MNNQLQPQQTTVQQIDIGSLLTPIIAIIMMVGFMKIMSHMFPEMMAPTPSTKMREPKPSEVIREKARQTFYGPIENKDWSPAQSAYQQLQLEPIGHELENRSIGITLEAAGDVIKELLDKQYADKLYITQKLGIVDTAMSQPAFKERHLSEHDNKLIQEAVNGYATLDFKTYFGIQCKALVMQVLRQDAKGVQVEVKSMQNEMKKDERFK